MKNMHLAASIERTTPKDKPCFADITRIVKLKFLRQASLGGLQISLRRIVKQSSGFTLIELIIVISILGVLSTMAVSQDSGYKDRAKVVQAKADILSIEVLIERFYSDNRNYPNTLNDVGVGTMLDPWGNPYQYLDITTAKGKGKLRKDKSLNPINSDFDLYSMGKDGKSKLPLTVNVSLDDIIRARDGQFVGLASDF